LLDLSTGSEVNRELRLSLRAAWLAWRAERVSGNDVGASWRALELAERTGDLAKSIRLRRSLEEDD
ncbi:MAG: hypothetical protein KC561_02860, partial [Myxococcales bacterium]|nr:hypothetical protein [Myxococcales bacterium]